MQIQIGNKQLKTIIICLFVIATLFAGVKVDAQESEDAITAVAWNSDGTSIAIGHLDGQVEVIAADGQVQVNLAAHTGRVTELAWHPDGQLLASGSADGSVRIWDVPSATLLRSYTALTLITGVLWSRDGSQLWAISIEDQPNLFVWSTDTGDLISSAAVGGLYDPQWNQDGTLLVSGSGGTVPVLVTTENDIRSAYLRNSDFPIVTGEQMFTAAWSPDSAYVAGGTPDGHVRVWNVNTTQLVMEVGSTEDYDVSTWRLSLIVELAFTPDGEKVQALDGSGVFRVWDITASELLTEEQLPVTEPPIYAAEFSPDGTKLAYGGEGGVLEIVDLGPPGPYFSDDFENGTGRWTVGGQWGLTSTSSHSPTHSMYINTTTTGNHTLTLTDPLDLTQATAPALTYWTHYSIWVTHAAYVEVSVDDGATWTWLYLVTNSTRTEWTEKHLDLSAYAGQTIRLRFRLYRPVSNLSGDKWWIDDVQVAEAAP